METYVLHSKSMIRLAIYDTCPSLYYISIFVKKNTTPWPQAVFGSGSTFQTSTKLYVLQEQPSKDE